MTQLTDIFGQPVNEGDKVAVGMSYGQSSVLRIGEVLAIKETGSSYSSGIRWSIRIKWTHNGRGNKWDVKESSIKYESRFSYAKLVVLPPEFVDKYPADIKENDEEEV